MALQVKKLARPTSTAGFFSQWCPCHPITQKAFTKKLRLTINKVCIPKYFVEQSLVTSMTF